jgi:hypothetical protein
VNLTREEDLKQHQAGELHRPNLGVLQSRQGAAGLTTKSTPVSSHPECNNDMESEIQRSEQTNSEAFGEECKPEEKGSHAGPLMKESGIQSSEQPKPAEPNGIDERRQSPHVVSVKGNSPSTKHKIVVFNEVSGFSFNLSFFCSICCWNI